MEGTEEFEIMYMSLEVEQGGSSSTRIPANKGDLQTM